MSELDNGPKEYWSQSCGEGDSDIDCETYYDKYILKYLNNVSKKKHLRTPKDIMLQFILRTEQFL